MPSNKLFEKFGLSIPQLLVIFVALIVTFVSTYTVILLVHVRFQTALRNELAAVLEGTSEAIRVWNREQRLLAQSLAREKHVLEITRALLVQPRKRGALLAAPAQRDMRYEMRSYLESGFYEGYFIIAPDNISLASSRDANVGTKNLLIRFPELLADVWNGNTRLTPIQRSDVPLKRGAELAASGHETMFMATPIKDEKGKIIALLTLRINPYRTLFPIMEHARIGETGESYAFDKYGTLLSRSRFEEQLRRIGLLAPEQSSVSNVQLRDPGIDLTKGKGRRPVSNELPLTRMAASAINGENGYDVEGYRDYRGVPVIGAWSWDPDLGVGFAAELDVAEAYSVFGFVRLTALGGAVITALIFVMLVAVFAAGKRKIDSAQRRLQAIVETSSEGIIVIDEHGIIESVNPAMEEIFGYTADQLTGNNVSMLMPEPHRSVHNDYLARYLETGESHVIGIGRETEAKRANGDVFPIELSVNRLLLGGGLHFAGTIRDISERKDAENALRLEKEAAENANKMLSLTRQALDRTGIGEFWVAAEGGRVLRINDYACQYLGYSREELLAMSVLDFTPDFPADQFGELIAPIKAQGWGRFEVVHQAKDGRKIPVEITSLYRPETDDNQEMFITFVIDITERKKTEQAIIQAREEAIEANRAKSTFLATMSHEIRTPLYGVVGTVDMLSHTKLDSSQQDLIHTAKDSSALLQRIIDDILDFSKIEAGRLELEKVPVTMESLIEKLGENLRYLAEVRHVEFLIYSDPELPKVKGDPVRLRQILYNLAGNAIKFSSGLTGRNGRVMVSALLENLENGRANICLRVNDNGIGMSAEVQKRLFMPFVQGEEETTRHYGGTGLGLVITKRLVEMMGGYVEMKSIEGEGSNFNVHISLERMADAPERRVSDLSGLKILLIQDNADLAGMVTSYLRHAGAEVMSVTPDKALAVCKKACDSVQEPVVVIDTEGDTAMGKKLRQELRSMVKDIELRFVLVGRGRRRYARPHGGDGMTLDFNVMHRATLLNAVAAVAGRESPMQELEAPKETLPDEPLSIDEAREKGRLILLADDNEINRKVISQQMQMLGYFAEMVQDGREALDKWHSGSYAMLMTDCHMPEMDGYQLSERIRQEEMAGVHLPIVAITADALKGTAQKCFAAGMDDYLTKPIQLNQLKKTLERWLPDTKQKSVDESVQKVPKKKPHKVVDPLALGRLLDTQDRKVLAEYYDDFLESSVPMVEQLRGTYHQGDLPALADLAHKLKSSARTVGANSLADCCHALEIAGKEEDTLAANQQMLDFFRLFDQVKSWIEQYDTSK